MSAFYEVFGSNVHPWAKILQVSVSVLLVTVTYSHSFAIETFTKHQQVQVCVKLGSEVITPCHSRMDLGVHSEFLCGAERTAPHLHHSALTLNGEIMWLDPIAGKDVFFFLHVFLLLGGGSSKG